MNKDLKDRVFKIPDDVFNQIHKTFTSLSDKTIDGTQRAKNLLRTKNVTYAQIKRIIHDLENGDPNSTQFQLAGGQPMLDWAKSFLNGERQMIKNNKTSQKRANNIAQINDIRKNPFLKKHTKKKRDYSIPTNMMKSNSDKTSVTPISSFGIFEEIERIKGLL
jgi:organic radical activating enzyme